eukprot:2562551-Rhodomonas_salina.1
MVPASAWSGLGVYLQAVCGVFPAITTTSRCTSSQDRSVADLKNHRLSKDLVSQHGFVIWNPSLQQTPNLNNFKFAS